jgi:uncharacterized protein (TIGR01244 family)
VKLLGRRAAAGVVVLVLAAATLGAPAEGPPKSVAPSLIPNYQLIRPDIATAGQPSEAALLTLKEMGFQVVIDLRAPEEGTAAERAVVEGAGLRYVSVPITPKEFSREDAAKVAQVLAEEGRGPVLLHCGTANRVGGVWTVIEVTKGRPYEAAEKEGVRIGLHSEAMKAAVKRVLGIDPPIH